VGPIILHADEIEFCKGRRLVLASLRILRLGGMNVPFSKVKEQALVAPGQAMSFTRAVIHAYSQLAISDDTYV
jgi:hypothetical protein